MLPLKQQPPIKQPSSRERERSRRPHRLVAHAKGLRGLWEQSAPVGCGGAVTQARLPGCDCICLLCPNMQLLSVARGESDLLDNSYSVSWGGSNHRWIEADILLFWCFFGISIPNLFIHPSIFFHIFNSGGWSLSLQSQSKRKGTPQTGRQSVKALTIKVKFRIAFKTFHGQAPAYITNLLRPPSSSRSLESC